jgi:signal transduction histidine kinase
VERLRLVDRLASDAAAIERDLIAHDLHDAIIQPYVGLQIGIGAVLQQVRVNQDVSGSLERLLEIAHGEIAHLRKYARDLRGQRSADSALVAGVRGIAARFADTADLEVRVEADERLSVQPRLAQEVLHIVAEGLSNIRRHTAASRATIHLHAGDQRIRVRIENGRNGVPE